MRSSLTSPSSFLLVISFLAGCSDDGGDCGPGDAPETGLTASATGVALSYGNLTSLAGNDCPADAPPEGVVSITIEGTQSGGAGIITFCIPRPDLLTSGTRSLGTTLSDADVQIIDVTGADAGCTYKLDSATPPTGSATASGVCDFGDSAEGFALSFAGGISLKRTCGATIDTVPVQLAGEIAVARRD